MTLSSSRRAVGSPASSLSPLSWVGHSCEEYGTAGTGVCVSHWWYPRKDGKASWSGPNFGRKRNRSGSCNVGTPLLPDSTSERECADAYERPSLPPSYPTNLTNTSSSSASDSCIESRERTFAPSCGIIPCHLNIDCSPGLRTANLGLTIHFNYNYFCGIDSHGYVRMRSRHSLPPVP